MYSYFLFSDSEKWHKEIKAKTWREALAVVRADESLSKKLDLKFESHHTRDYKMRGSSYAFSLVGVP